MIKIFKNGINTEDILNRKIESYSEFEKTVDEIIGEVISSGDEALLRFTRRFDCPTLENIEVSPEEIDEAYERLDKNFLAVLKEAKQNIETFHRNQLREGFRLEKEGGIVLGQKFTPIKKVGIYVPGGTAAYPSTVLMNAVPASIAGCEEIIMVTPAGKDGRVKDEILAAARLSGVSRVFRIGGAQAVAALAFGTETVPAVHKIVGPGNIFVALAKKKVFGTVSIDMIAGPSEILVIADRTADPRFVAADLLSQAEHDRLASAVLVTDSPSLAEAVSEELEKQIPLLSRSEIARYSIDNQGKIIVTESIDKAIEISNEIAPEHLEICVDEPFTYLDKIENAGSIFLEKYSPEPLGDYFAGPNHTLPTSGSAKFSSPLSVDDFVKKSSYIYYPEEKLKESSGKIAEFATREGLTAHAKSVTIRFED